jgi:hypothetical protein
MKKITRQIISVVATGSLLLSLVAPVSAMTLEISGNGSDSTNKVDVESNQNTTVVQSNNAEVTNNITAKASTGGNEAEDNTGGNVSIETGDATTDVTASTTVNSNAATVDCCSTQGADVLISGNGSDSHNRVYLDLNENEKKGPGSNDPTGTSVFQNNKADITNNVTAKSKSGGNEAEDNTGGDVSIKTGDATTSVTLTNTANANSAMVGGEGAQAGSVSLKILGNGSESDNKIDLELGGGVLVSQANNADVDNNVYAKASTGENEVEDNTGGTASIETGDATTTVTVDNAVNFNQAAVDCGCMLDISGKIAGNGEDSTNKIEAELGGDLEIFQGNCAKDIRPGSATIPGGDQKCEVENNLTGKAQSGDNELEDSTGSVNGDPSIETGDAESTVDVSNAGNSNVYGAEAPSEWPKFDFNFNISLSLEQLLAFLGH